MQWPVAALCGLKKCRSATGCRYGRALGCYLCYLCSNKLFVLAFVGVVFLRFRREKGKSVCIVGLLVSFIGRGFV